MNKVAGQLRIAAAEAEAERRKEQALATARELAHRLAPKTVARNAWEGAKVKGADLAEDAVDAVKQRPLAVTGAVAAVTLFLAREPIRRAIVDIYDAMTSDEEEAAPRPAPRRSRTKRVEDK
ncbi:hypothetical protein [Sphingomonas mesophila]|uniref:hypothetical protein n=1 Tax=Sphingomonas mesophila TaxID=2303576 RepID=UPI000E571FA5|nr:hypothetical protein [Sphingomonas mesophila]